MLDKLHNFITTNFRGCVLFNKSSCYQKMQEAISFSDIEHNTISENTDFVCIKFGKEKCAFNIVWDELEPIDNKKRFKLVKVIPVGEQMGCTEFRNKLSDIITEARATGTSTNELVEKYAESLLTSSTKC